MINVIKNVSKKKDLWQKISTNLKNCYDINMSGNFLFVKLLLFNVYIINYNLIKNCDQKVPGITIR